MNLGLEQTMLLVKGNRCTCFKKKSPGLCIVIIVIFTSLILGHLLCARPCAPCWGCKGSPFIDLMV